MNANLTDDWIKQVEPHFFALDEVPLTGNKNFPWEELTRFFQEKFEIPDLSFQTRTPYWTELKDLDASKYCNILSLSPIQSSILWVIPLKTIEELFETFLGVDSNSSVGLHHEKLSQGFFQFLSLETLSCIEKTGFFENLTPLLSNNKISGQETENPLGTCPEAHLCFDVGLQLFNKTFWGNLYLSNDFIHEWKKFHALSQKKSLSSLDTKIELLLNVEVAETVMSFEEWSKISLGDLLVLPNSSYEPSLKKGTIHLTFNGKKIFRGRLRNDHIKLNEHPIYFEELAPMDKDHPLPPPSEPNPEEEFSDFDDDDFFFEDDELAAVLEEELKEKSPEDDTSNGEIEDEETRQKSDENLNVPPPEESSNESKIITPEEIPLNLSIEIAHLRLTIKQLLELSPGNQLSLGKDVDNLVDLVVNGKCIGKGELIRIGDVLGVRILQL